MAEIVAQVVMGLDKNNTLSAEDLNALRNSIVCTLARYCQVEDAFEVYGEIKKSDQPVMQNTLKTLIVRVQRNSCVLLFLVLSIYL